MSAAYIITYLNKDHLDTLTQDKKFDFLNLYIDIRSVTPNFFDEKQMKLIINDSESIELYIRRSIFNFLKFVDYHIGLAFSYNMWPRFFFFCDVGESLFHKQICKDYKANRCSPTILSEEEYLRTKNLVNGFLKTIQSYFMEIPFVYYIFLEYIETDFIPYYILKKFNFSEKDLHIIMSRDKDLGQCLDVRSNCYQYFLDNKKGKVLLDESNVISFHFKSDKVEIKPRHIPLILSLAGDSSDNVVGIKGIGYKRAIQLLNEYKDILGSDNFKNVNLICQNQDLETKSLQNLAKKVCENKEIVITNLKLTDFDYITENLSSTYVVRIDRILKHRWGSRDSREFTKQLKEALGDDVYFYHIVNLFKSYNELLKGV